MNKIREERLRQGYRIIDLAVLAGVGYQTVWNLEQGLASRARPDTKEKIAAGLGLKVEELFLEK